MKTALQSTTARIEQKRAITANLEEVARIAEAQWTCITALKNKYKGRKIRGSTNLFEDGEWRGIDDNLAVIWTSIDPDNNREALILLLKIGVYHHLETKGGYLRSQVQNVSAFMTFFNDSLTSKAVLTGQPGDLLVGFNEINSSDVLLAFDKRILLGRKYAHSHVYLNLIKDIPKHAIDNFSIFTCRYEYPWNGTTYGAWIKKRYAELGVSVPETKPYLAMPPETTQPLIERSMLFIERFAEEILVAHAEARLLHQSSYTEFLQSAAGVRFIKERMTFFESLGKSNNYRAAPGKTTVKRFERIVDLLRAACINIILLTTGLRNIDLTLLRVGCCQPSGRVDMLFYVDAEIKKTGIRMLLPVPEQTKKAIGLLERLRWDDANPYVIAPKGGFWTHDVLERAEANVSKSTVNRWISKFATWFDIPFLTPDRGDEEYTAHCYRATVAGWLDSASNLSILMVRRLFGHANHLMPLAYLNHNPIFVKARKDAIEEAANAMAKRMGEAAAKGQLSGVRGDELIQGFKAQRAALRASSESLTDNELLTTFQERIRERILNGSMLAMMTPFGVICTRNPNDSSQPPCARRSDREKLKEYEIDQELWRYVQSAPNPGQCVGKRCEHSMLGPWSTAIKESFIWYADFLEGRVGQALTTDELREEAKSFIRQYAPDIEKIFGSERKNA